MGGNPSPENSGSFHVMLCYVREIQPGVACSIKY
jgi:hypothetical protein